MRTGARALDRPHSGRPARRGTVGSALLVLALAGCSAAAPREPYVPRARGLKLETVVSGLDHPVQLASPPGDLRLFIVEQPGRIRVIKDGRLLERPFLDLTDRVRWGNERGLLSVTFHPDYAHNGSLFVNYTDRRGDTRIERYLARAGADRAYPESGKLILTVRQPYSNHNGGLTLFGPDGMLYIGMGDGGGTGDPHGNGQNLETLLGKMLRVDVDHGDPYAIPPDNPFVSRAHARPEIWALGLRNPWRFCFDPAEGLLYIADVGQDHWEEIDIAPAATGGLDYGWNRMEGNHCFEEPHCDQTGLAAPAVEYAHREGCSVTGGLVYRGRGIPGLDGHYFYSDYCTGFLRSFRYAAGRVTAHREWALRDHPPVASFGQDAAGELYVVSHDGTIFKIVGDR